MPWAFSPRRTARAARSDNNSATLVSTGRTFRFEDQLDDFWGEVSAGVNVFNFSQTTAVFAKLDVTFGDDLTGVGGKAGMRVNWSATDSLPLKGGGRLGEAKPGGGQTRLGCGRF